MKIVCSHCKAIYEVADNAYGQTMMCSACGSPMVVATEEVMLLRAISRKLTNIDAGRDSVLRAVNGAPAKISAPKRGTTVYGVLAAIIGLVWILVEIALFMGCLGASARFAALGGPAGLVGALMLWLVSSVFLTLFFGACAAMFRLTDAAVRTAGITLPCGL